MQNIYEELYMFHIQTFTRITPLLLIIQLLSNPILTLIWIILFWSKIEMGLDICLKSMWISNSQSLILFRVSS